ncbi:hypothetical protein J7443_04510 [Tropicibacter sp. R15_0]|uniref:cupin domain-containing protein n=1 Tax=Tropicibacter sp. R15_0 TaxID=2821101 RepID=UPI001AD9D1A2|nr:hypothetical protein [Tropicibacter sp. R15_0]MBO9464484.1 hypothetical protein [Tropicibacter sp. R15_0]
MSQKLFSKSLMIAVAFLANAASAQHCDHGGHDMVTQINGHVPPGKVASLVDVTVMLDTILPDGNRMLVTKGTRRAGTRVGIHIHEYGGHTCVMSGSITDFVEGHDPGLFPADSCYYMPANTPMTAANLGTQDAVLIDTFVLPPDAEPITIIETCATE